MPSLKWHNKYYNARNYFLVMSDLQFLVNIDFLLVNDYQNKDISKLIN